MFSTPQPLTDVDSEKLLILSTPFIISYSSALSHPWG